MKGPSVIRFYRVDLQHPMHGDLVGWATTLGGARLKLQEMCRDSGVPRRGATVAISRVELQPGAHDLVAWLNRNFDADNG